MPALHHGSLELWKEKLPPEILAYTRKSNIEEVLMVLNFSDQLQLVNLEGVGFKTKLYSIHSTDDVKDGFVELSPWSGMIIK